MSTSVFMTFYCWRCLYLVEQWAVHCCCRLKFSVKIFKWWVIGTLASISNYKVNRNIHIQTLLRLMLIYKWLVGGAGKEKRKYALSFHSVDGANHTICYKRRFYWLSNCWWIIDKRTLCQRIFIVIQICQFPVIHQRKMKLFPWMITAVFNENLHWAYEYI